LTILIPGILLASVLVIIFSFDSRNEEFRKLFNGRDFTGWFFYLRDYGVNHDPKNVFQIKQDGILYITGEVFGYLSTMEEFDNFHLKLDFKWGEKKWPPRLNQKRDSGIWPLPRTCLFNAGNHEGG